MNRDYDTTTNGGVPITRRAFFRGGIATIILLGIGFMVFDFKKTVRRMLKRDVKKLGVTSDDLRTFMADAGKERFWAQFSVAKRVLICVQHALLVVGIRTPWYGKYLRYRNQITGHFLLSTDLFQSPYTEGQTVKYIGFHNPYKAPCASPFSNLRNS